MRHIYRNFIVRPYGTSTNFIQRQIRAIMGISGMLKTAAGGQWIIDNMDIPDVIITERVKSEWML